MDSRAESAGTVPAPASAKGELETMLDGVFHDLTRTVDVPAESGKGGTTQLVTERVKVRKISIQKMDMLGKAWGKMQQEVCVYIDKDIEYVEQLTEESFIAAMSEGRRLNFPSYQKWFAWQQQTAEALGNTEVMQKAMSAAVEAALRSVEAERRPSPKS